MLPPVKNVPLQKEVFPRRWQTVIFRNYGIVSPERIAQTLSCDVETVKREAERMGLCGVSYDGLWEKRGYITIIRNNWYLLPTEQIMTLLGYDESRMEFVIYKEDFLDVKLGGFKPFCPPVKYSPLTEEEKAHTRALAEKIKTLFPKNTRPFVFFGDKKAENGKIEDFGNGIRLVHGYLTPCGDALMENDEEYLPDELLAEYQRHGVNGVWMHGLLSALSPYPFDPDLSKDYITRRQNLRKLVNRCAKYGIKVYIYFNEPRFLPMEKAEKFNSLIGSVFEGKACLCFEKPEVREYLYSAVKDLFSDVKGIGGVITITMSENPTHCNSRVFEDTETSRRCPICKDLPADRSAVAVNNVFARAIRDSGSDGKLLAYLWGWTSYMGWTKEQTERSIRALDKDVVVVCVSECELKINKGGIPAEIIDYSISNPGPSEITKFMFSVAQETGHRCVAKIQINNSWENSSVPYLPVYDLVLKHLENLDVCGVHEYMLTWTLGGYPSPMLDLVSEYSREGKNFSIDGWYKKHYGNSAVKTRKAVEFFCKGFKEYPFSILSLYASPKTLGPANLWSLTPELNSSTMVCYSFDDYEHWIYPYPYEVYVSQYEKLLTLWEKGLAVLSETEDAPLSNELKICAEAAYIHFKADYLQTKFSCYKREPKKYAEELRAILKEEKAIAERLLKILPKSSAVGFETSNHYFYNERNLIEKVLQTELLITELIKAKN